MCCLSRVLPVWRSFETEVLFDKSLAFWVWACYNEQETTRESEAFFVNVLLTSCGLETPAIEKQFLSMLPKPMEAVTAMFIPTAAVDPDAIEVLPKCLNDLLMCGIQRKNIFVNDLHTPLTGEIEADVVYLCGGNTEYLLRRINHFFRFTAGQSWPAVMPAACPLRKLRKSGEVSLGLGQTGPLGQ